MERRAHPRRAIARAVRIDTETRKDLLGITRDVSAWGLRFHSASAFAVGERVSLKILGEGCEGLDTVAFGAVVRAETYAPDPGVVFPHVTAVYLENPLPKRLVPSSHA